MSEQQNRTVTTPPLLCSIPAKDLAHIRDSLKVGAEYITEAAQQYKNQFGMERNYHRAAHEKMEEDLRTMQKWIKELHPAFYVLSKRH